MSPQAANTALREDGTASIELVAVVPFLVLAVLAAAQIGLAGQALWSAGIAARAGARAELVGRDPQDAAIEALPSLLRADAEVNDDDAVSVRVAIPRLLPGMPRVTVGASSGLADRDG